ncbi:MAG: DUF1365 domain-containing protein [Myxococcota bacterium]
MESALYEGTVYHARAAHPPHAFAKRLFMAYLDLDELDRVFAGRLFWGVERRRLVTFRRTDQLGDPAIPLAESVRRLIRERTGRSAEGPIRVLTQLRTAGYVFNPLSLHYAFDPAGGLEAVVADVRNTPWNERHCYVLPATEGAVDLRIDKRFHVSPFLPMDHAYRFRLDAPARALRVRIENFDRAGRPAFAARLELERRGIDGRSLARALLRFPLMSVQVIGGIYWQALRLHRLGAPFHPHPNGNRRTEALA